MGLTVTKVVFEFCCLGVILDLYIRLTVTKVVFEFFNS